MKKLAILLTLLPYFSLGQSADVVSDNEIARIAFGSCSSQDKTDLQLWQEISKTNPDIWIWLGDNIYGDTEDMSVMRRKYDLQKSHSNYQELLSKTEVIGIWDDHDFGVNDGGKEYPMKDQSKEELFRFLDVKVNHPARNRKGAYQSYTYNSQIGKLKVILLDTRYFRDSLKWKNPGTPQKQSIVNETGDVLGETQWQWLKNQLADSSINFFIVGSGFQVIPDEHKWEKWSNFPKSRKRLLSMIETTTSKPLVLISGDRHMSEVSRLDLPHYPHPLYEFTSSSLTNPSGLKNDVNTYRLQEKIIVQNFALMTIKDQSDQLNITLEFIGKDDEKLATHSFDFTK